MRFNATGALCALIFSLSIPVHAAKFTMKEGYWARVKPEAVGDGVFVSGREEEVEIVQTLDGWVLAKFTGGSYAGKRFWVSSNGINEYINTSPGGQSAATNGPDHAQVFYADENGWPVRDGAGTKGTNKIDWISDKTPLELVEVVRDRDGDNWYKVKYNEGDGEKTAFISESRVHPDSDSGTEACPGGCPVIPAAPSNSDDIEQIVASDGKGHQLSSEFNAKCSRFINGEGLGSLGQLLIASVKKIANGCFYQGTLFNDLCPKYNDLSESKKNAVMAIVFASIAQDESSCRDDAQNSDGPYGTADGLFQLEFARSLREGGGRDPKWCRTQEYTNTQAFEFQMECSVSMVKDKACKSGNFINYPGIYWQELKRPGRRVTTLARRELERSRICR